LHGYGHNDDTRGGGYWPIGGQGYGDGPGDTRGNGVSLP
jgi:hypothetical protein